MGGRRTRRWRAAAAGALAVALTGYVTLFLVRTWMASDTEDLDRLVGYSNVYAFVLTVVPLVGGLCVFALRGPRTADQAGGTGPEVVERAAQRLAAAVARQWRRELVARGVPRAHPLTVTWVPTARPVTARAGMPLPAEGPPGETGPGGGLGELAAWFGALPYRQLVVLGEPGAGKSVAAMLLAAELAEEAQPGAPVPVLLAFAGWDPAEPFDAWVARRTGEEYPDLAPEVAAALVAARRIMPVLDGLDEMPVAARVRVIERIDAACDGWPFVLTCRSEEYEAAVVGSERFLSSAAVVELEPVGAREVVAYLEGRVRAGDARWEALFAAIGEEPELSAALSTPLMIYLLLVVYRQPGTEPGELCGLGRNEIEERLLTAFLPAVYAPLGEDEAAPWPGVERAGRWAGFLACRLRHDGEHRLAWWRLVELDPRLSDPRRVVPATLAVVALAVAVVTAVTGRALIGIAAGVCTGVIAGTAAAGLLSGPTPPVYANLTLRGRSGHLARAVRVHFTSWFTAGFAAGAAAGLVIVLLADLLAGTPSSLTGWLLGGVMQAVLVGVTAGLVAGVCGGLVGWLKEPADEVRARDPASVLRADRAVATLNGAVAAVVCAAVAGLPVTAYAGPYLGAAYGLAAAVTAGLAVALGTTAWGRFCVARLWLASRGVLSLRLMRFLTDAHRRGMLRHAGGVYQFRHANLRDRLAGEETVRPEALRPVTSGENSRGQEESGGSGERPGGPPVGHGGFTTLAMLAGAVLATSTTTFLTLYLAVSANGDAVRRAVGCELEMERRWGVTWPGAFLTCSGPIYADQARWVVWGLVALVVVAGLGFLLHPVWIIRRNGYVPLSSPQDRALADMVGRLSRQVGLARAPRLLLSPHMWTTARVFGRPGRRYLAVDAPLTFHLSTDPRAAEAILLHELAHLRNGDVDRTYLTIAIWRSFLLLGLLPFVPALLLVADDWTQTVRAAASVAALTALVLLTRAAVLRRSELHADAAAGNAELLRAPLSRFPSPRRGLLAWTRVHPDIGRRIAHLDAPADMLPAGTLELTGAGMTAAIMTGNLQNFLGGPALFSLLGVALAGLLCVPALVVAIVEAVWAESSVPSPRVYLRPAAAVTAGYLVGDQLVLAHIFDKGQFPSSPGRYVLAALMLLAGTAFLGAWAASATRGLLHVQRRTRRRALAVVVTSGTLAAVPWFVVWHAFRGKELFTLLRSTFPHGVVERWSEPWSTLVTLHYGPLEYVLVNPLTLPGLLLLCLVPLTFTRRRASAGPRTDLARVTGLAGGVTVLLATTALVLLTAGHVPDDVRTAPELPRLYIEAYAFVIVLAQAAVAFLVAVRSTTSRLALALFAALLTGVMAASGFRFLDILAGCAGLYAAPCAAVPADSPHIAALLQSTLIKGAVAAVPATALGIATGTVWRHLRPPKHSTPQVSVRRTRLTQVTTVITAVVLVVAAIERLPYFVGVWMIYIYGP
ncbi:hypothetical protein GCM10009677_15800 [Sphaerisporangium rubeum]|uniref:Zn-dependent protease with chaperone function n=1 Tax=Sphaerisporangium rubeum TaxID=321317 RepID=A0A7X0M8R3_9ACTN|nr:M48 family metalloprotease [Sphaerisporangium rubeum]MBB6475667.1 Zn-dependent protease with chaperone function [Sphaerisporangium rubeum]